jgi:hypothetical protein
VPHFLPCSLQCMTSDGKFHLRDRGSATIHRVSSMAPCHLRSLITPDYQFVMQSISRHGASNGVSIFTGCHRTCQYGYRKEPCSSICTNYSHDPLLFCPRNRSTAGAVSHAICHCLPDTEENRKILARKTILLQCSANNPYFSVNFILEL